MTFTTSATITAQSAASTLSICLKQARKDTAKTIAFTAHIAQLLTSREAVKTYKMIYNAVVIAGMVAIALGSTAREIMDNYIESCETIPAPVEVPVVETEQAIEPAPSVEAAWHHAIAPFTRKARPATNWQAMTSEQLRKACQAHAIKWRGVNNGKHLSKPAMVAALRAIAA